jgi:hypothetical protein
MCTHAKRRQRNRTFYRPGVTFTVYGWIARDKVMNKGNLCQRYGSMSIWICYLVLPLLGYSFSIKISTRKGRWWRTNVETLFYFNTCCTNVSELLHIQYQALRNWWSLPVEQLKHREVIRESITSWLQWNYSVILADNVLRGSISLLYLITNGSRLQQKTQL